MEPEKRNYFVYFYAYFAAQVIFIYVNVFLPVYFFHVLDINYTELAFIQIFAYSAFFIKPIIAIYFDRIKSINKILIIVSSFGTLFSLIFLIIYLNVLIIFGIFLGINFAFISIIDTAIDKIIVSNSPDEKSKDRNALITQLGAIIGAIFPNVIFLIIFKDIYSIATWQLFYLIGILAIFPIIFMSFLLRKNTLIIEENINISESEINKKSIILISIILFLSYSHRIFEWTLEPWILSKYGEENFSLFLIFLIIIIIINAFGVILAGTISNRFSRKKIMILSSLSIGILFIIAPFTDMIMFFLILAIVQIFSGFIIINLISLMISTSHKKVVYYQVMATFAILASVIFIPLGTILSVIISTEIIIVIAGALRILCIIPICLLEDV